MTSIQVKNVPSDVHQTLRERAVGSGQSLQEYLLQLLCEQARTPTLDEVLERAAGRAGGNILKPPSTRVVTDASAVVLAARTDREARSAFWWHHCR